MPYINCEDAGCEEFFLTGEQCWQDHWIPDDPGEDNNPENPSRSPEQYRFTDALSPVE